MKSEYVNKIMKSVSTIKYIIYLIFIVNIIGSSPVMADSNVRGSLDDTTCLCGQDTTISAYIEGDARDLGGNIFNRQYYIRLVDDNNVVLSYIQGKYTGIVNPEDELRFYIRFILKCDDDCKTIHFIKIDRLEVYKINPSNGDLITQEHTFEIIESGKSVRNSEQSTLHLEVGIESKSSSVEDSSKTFACMKGESPIAAKIIGSKNLFINIPKNKGDTNYKMFDIEIQSLVDFSVDIVDKELRWQEPDDVYVSTSCDKDTIDSRDKASCEMTFYVDSGAKRGFYPLDIYIHYRYTDTNSNKIVQGSKIVDPGLHILSPGEEPPTDTGKGCDSCHASTLPIIRGDSSNIFGLVILVISLLTIGIFVMRRKR